MTYYDEARAWEQELPGNEKLVLLVIAKARNGKSGKSFPSQRSIAKQTGYSVRQVERIIRSLAERDVIKITRKRQSRKWALNHYTFAWHEYKECAGCKDHPTLVSANEVDQPTSVQDHPTSEAGSPDTHVGLILNLNQEGKEEDNSLSPLEEKKEGNSHPTPMSVDIDEQMKVWEDEESAIEKILEQHAPS